MASRGQPDQVEETAAHERRTTGSSDRNDTATDLDEENFRHNFSDFGDDAALDGGDSRISTASVMVGAHARPLSAAPARWGTRDTKWVLAEDEADNDVPTSLLIEPNATKTPKKHAQPRAQHDARAQATRHPRDPSGALWEAATAQQPLHERLPPRIQPRTGARSGAPRRSNTAKEKAMWRWVNVSNLDNFVRDIYDYYRGGGMWTIMSFNALRLLETLFVAVLLTFLCQCVDYSKLPHSRALHEVVISQCTRKMSFLWNIGIWLYSFFFIWKSVQFFFEIRRLKYIRDFFVYLLDIPDQDMQTISWQDVVARIMALRDHNPKTAAITSAEHRRILGSQSKQRLDAHDIANRLMRKENYLIALINKDVLDLSLPLPFLRDRQLFSKTMEWYIHFSILDMAFNEYGQVQQGILRADHRRMLSQKLKQRLYTAGILSLVFAPFVFGYVLIVNFLTYYNEYQKDPKLAAARKYTTLAEWKFREFNELPHIFYERLHMSYPFATRYLDQFPKRVTEEIARTVAFMSGALTAVLAILTILDSELFLGFEITKDRTVLFYLGVFGAIWAVTRGMVSEETLVFNPEYAMRNVIEYTHHMPKHWDGRLHSTEVKQEFSELYKMKVVIMLEEIMGIVTTPMVLLISLPKRCDQIIDFFREFTIHVDGLGYVCSFAEFDFKKGLGEAASQPQGNRDIREDYYATKHGKMAASYYGFIDNYVINPKTGIPGHQPPGGTAGGPQPFHPPPAFPALTSPAFAGDLQASHGGAPETGRARSRMAGFGGGPSRGGHVGKVVNAQPSPMASLLLDAHHQPGGASLARSLHQSRHPRASHRGGSRITERPEEGGSSGLGLEEETFEGGGVLDESTWATTSPGKGLSRENSAVNADDPDVGVLGMLYEFQRNHGPTRSAV